MQSIKSATGLQGLFFEAGFLAASTRAKDSAVSPRAGSALLSARRVTNSPAGPNRMKRASSESVNRHCGPTRAAEPGNGRVRIPIGSTTGWQKPMSMYRKT
jgi:hypothetical protein